MRVLVFSFVTIMTVFAWARDAQYVVPVTDPELVPYSRFEMEILEAYEDKDTQTIAYKLPELLAGQEGGKDIVLSRIPDTPNSWISEELRADCTDINDVFSCNININKGPGFDVDKILTKDKALDFLNSKTGLGPDEKEAWSAVIDQFHSGDPAGILSYGI